MHLQQASINGDDFIGLFGLATDKYSLLSVNFPKIEVLKVPEVRMRIYGTGLLGLFCAGNSHGLLVPNFVSKETLAFLKKSLKDVNVGVVKGNYNAIGNLIAANDKAAIISEKIDRQIAADTLDVEVVQKKIGSHDEVGSCCVATNRGFLAHPDAEHELKDLTDIFKVQGNVGSVNFGFPFPKAGLIANSNGYVAGKTSSGIELGRIDEVLGFL